MHTKRVATFLFGFEVSTNWKWKADWYQITYVEDAQNCKQVCIVFLLFLHCFLVSNLVVEQNQIHLAYITNLKEERKFWKSCLWRRFLTCCVVEKNAISVIETKQLLLALYHATINIWLKGCCFHKCCYIMLPACLMFWFSLPLRIKGLLYLIFTNSLTTAFKLGGLFYIVALFSTSRVNL